MGLMGAVSVRRLHRRQDLLPPVLHRRQAVDQALGGSVARSDGRWLTSAYQAASFG